MTVLGKSDGQMTGEQLGDAELVRLGLQVTWAVRSDIGKRRARNEDSAVCTGVLFSVADGVGGHAAGDLASAAVVEQFAAEHLSYPVSAEAVYGSLTRASESVARISAAAARDAGTTVTGAALSVQNSVPSWLIFNIGDSRVYAFAQGELVQVTRDHSVVGELVARGKITPAEAEVHPDRNQILKAIGFDMDPVPDFWATPLNDGLRLLVCSDGLSKEVRDPQIAHILGSEQTPSAAADRLVQQALDNSGSDNITVIVVDTATSAPSMEPILADGDTDEEDTIQ